MLRKGMHLVRGITPQVYLEKQMLSQLLVAHGFSRQYATKQTAMIRAVASTYKPSGRTH